MAIRTAWLCRHMFRHLLQVNACAKWLEYRPEYFQPLGPADGLAQQAADGTWSRSFASGTKVFARGQGRNFSSCIEWADSTRTGAGCDDSELLAGGYAGLGYAGLPATPS